MSGAALTPYQARFCEEYLVDCNASAAIRRAGYTGTAPAEAARRMLRSARVQAELQRQREATSKKLRISKEAILERLARIAYGDVRRLYDEHGKPRPITDLDDDEAALIAGFDVVEIPGGPARVVKYRIADQRKAHELLAKLQGYEQENIHVTGTGGTRVFIPSNGRETGLDWNALLRNTSEYEAWEARRKEAAKPSSGGDPKPDDSDPTC